MTNWVFSKAKVTPWAGSVSNGVVRVWVLAGSGVILGGDLKAPGSPGVPRRLGGLVAYWVVLTPPNLPYWAARTMQTTHTFMHRWVHINCTNTHKHTVTYSFAHSLTCSLTHSLIQKERKIVHTNLEKRERETLGLCTSPMDVMYGPSIWGSNTAVFIYFISNQIFYCPMLIFFLRPSCSIP